MLVAGIALGAGLAHPRAALAQGADAGAPANADEPGPVAVPRGASGAAIVPPKDPGAPPPPAVVITPPQVVKDEGAEYPRDAVLAKIKEPVTVVLVLDIDATGAVAKAVVQTPVGHGFDEAALAAARKLVFSPAKKNGAPVAARIRHKYEFVPPLARITGRAVSEGRDQPIAGAEVSVRGADNVTRTSVSGADGTWTVDGVPAGSYHVSVAASGFGPRESEEAVDPGEEIQVVYRFTRNAAVVLAPKPAPGKEDEDVEEVHVRGVRPPREITRRTLEQREMSRIPGTNGDALRSLQNLPGVARPPGFAGLLIVRGSGPQDTNVFVDGSLIPLVYHFGGLSSVVPTEMLEKIDFYPGNFSAQYGRVMGGIVDIGIRDPKKDGKIHGLAQVDLIDARVLAEGPIGKTGWNFLVAGRRSYVDVWLKPVLEQAGAGVTTAPVYYDYQALVQKDFNSHSSFRLMFFGSDDKLDLLIKSVNASDPSVGGGISAHTGFWRVQGRYKNRFSDDTELRMTAAVGEDFLDFDLGDNYFKVTTYPITSKVELAQKMAAGVTMNVGMDMLYSPYKVDVRFPPLPRPGEAPSGPFLSRPPLTSSDTDALYRPGLYDEFEITPWRGSRIVPGVRIDYAKDTKKWDVSPRFIARQDLKSSFPRTTLKGGIGVFRQPPQPQETNLVFGQPGLVSNTATHYGFGVEQEITRPIDISVEGFYKQLDDLVTPRSHNEGRGRSVGAETLLRYKPDARFFGWLAYTLSRTVQQATPEDPIVPSRWDQTHILTVLGSYRLGRGWEIGGRFRLVSGNLYTPRTYGFFDENAGADLAQSAYPTFGSRFPAFHQLDVRVDKTWRGKDVTMSAYLDVQNVYNYGNVEGVSYNYNFTQSTYASGLPILPSIGVRAEF